MDKISQEPKHWIFPTKFKQTYKERTSDLQKCSMTLNWTSKITKIVVLIPQGRSKNMRQKLTMDIGHSWEESKWYQGCAVECGGKWDLRASQMLEFFYNSGHPVFQGVSPLGRGILKKRNDRESIHCNGKYGNLNLLYRTVHATNQLCIYGAVSKLCGPNSGDASQCRPERVRKMSPETQTKQEDPKSLVDFSDTTACIGKPNCFGI